MTTKIHRSLFSAVEIPPCDLLSYIFSNPYGIQGSSLAYVDAITGESRTFENVIQHSRSLKNGLSRLGVQHDDVVAVFSPNSIDFATICFGIIGCGASVAPLNIALTWSEVQAQLKTCRAQYMIVHSSLLPTALKAIKDTAVRNIIHADDESVLPERAISINGLIHAEVPTPPVKTPPELLNKRPAFICFSSGTTGAAKGVIVTHQNLVANLQQWQRVYFDSTRPSQTNVAFLPFSHTYAINVFLCGGILRGQTTVVLPRFHLEMYLRSIQDWKPKDLYLVPPIALLLVKDPLSKKYDLSSVRKILSAAAPLSSELASALEATFQERYGTTIHCHQSWGLTETSPLATGVPPSRMDKRWTVGRIIPNMEFRFVDPVTMEDVVEMDGSGSLKPAEILCRGPNVTPGYCHNEQATQEAFYIGSDGLRWFRTGDIATIDRDGFVTIQDRIKEIIKYKGLQVTPSELEGKLLENPSVKDCAVTSIYHDDKATELPVGFIVLEEKVDASDLAAVERNIHGWLKPRVANHKQLRGGIRFVKTIPKSPSGKILRRKLRDSLKTTTREAKL